MSWQDKVKNNFIKAAIYVSGLLSSTAVAAQTDQTEQSENNKMEILKTPDSAPTKAPHTSVYAKGLGVLLGQPSISKSSYNENKDTSTVKSEPNSTVSAGKTMTAEADVHASGETNKKSTKQLSWENTQEGKEAIQSYIKALEKIGENPAIHPGDIVYIRALYKLNRDVAMLDGTGYVMDREDFKGITPDSLQNELAEKAGNWLTPAKYVGASCAHAVKGNLFENGLCLNASGIVPACDMEEPLSKDVNFIGFEVQNGESYFAPNGGIKVYRKSKNHPYGHIGIAINDGTSETSKDCSDKSRHKINEDNYSGVICYVTSHSKASFETCVKAWGRKYKNENRPSMLAPHAPLEAYTINITPRQIFETAIACKEQYFRKYTAAINQMPKKYRDADGYVIGPSIKTPLLAYNVKIAKKPKAKKPVYRGRYSGR